MLLGCLLRPDDPFYALDGCAVYGEPPRMPALRSGQRNIPGLLVIEPDTDSGGTVSFFPPKTSIREAVESVQGLPIAYI